MMGLVAAAVSTGACGDSGGGTSPDAARVDARTAADAASPDATPRPDATPVCPGELFFTGDYVDWDSTLQDFRGIFGAEVTEVGNPANRVTTAPNGRVLMCLPADVDSIVEFTHADYLTMTFAVDRSVAAQGPFAARGLTTARANELVLGLTGNSRDPDKAMVAVIHDGATVTIDAANDGAFPLFEGAMTFFAGVDASSGSATLSADPACAGPATFPVVANQLSFVRLSCQ